MANPIETSTTTNDERSDHVFTYNDNALEFGETVLKDEDVITVVHEADGSYVIFSLVPISEGKSLPFELQSITANTLPATFLDTHLFGALPQHLQPPNHIHILISTLSGTGLASDFFGNVLHPVLNAVGLADSSYSILRTESPDTVKSFAKSVLLKEANKGTMQTVLLLSGDGGVVDIINGLMGDSVRSDGYVPPTLSQLPLGTGNALFHSLHKPSTIPSIYIQGLHTLLHGLPKPLPIFEATFSPGARVISNEGQAFTPLVNHTLYGAVVASYGLHATLVADSDTKEYRKHGDKRFGLVAKDLLSPPDGSAPHAYLAKVLFDKQVLERREHGYVLATLVSNLEKAFTISPASKPLDGQLRVVDFGPLSGDETMAIMQAAYANGSHVEQDKVGYTAVDGLRIQVLEEGEDWKWKRFCIDGLIVGVERNGWMEVRLVPSNSAAVYVASDT